MDAPATGSAAVLRTMLFAGGCLALAACAGEEGSDPMTPPVTVTVTVTPTTVELAPGETATVVATVTGGSGTVLFASSNDAVATVSSGGLVTGVTAGAATITATLSGTTASAAAQVTVTEPEYALSIVAVTQNGQPVDPSDVSGVIEVTVEYDVPSGFEGRIDLSLEDAVVASVELPEAAAAQGTATGPRAVPEQTGIQVPTSGLELDYTGAPGGFINVITKNGDNEFTGSLRRNNPDPFAEEVVVAEVHYGDVLTLNNPSGFALTRFEGERQGTDAQGRRWHGGDIAIETGFAEFDIGQPGFRLGGPIAKDKIIFFVDNTQQEAVVEVPATEFGVAGFGSFNQFAFIESQVRAHRAQFFDGEGVERAAPFFDFWLVGQDGIPSFGPGPLYVDQVPPGAPDPLTSGQEEGYWVNDSWTPGDITQGIGASFEETVTDGGSGVKDNEFRVGPVGEEKQALDVFEWDETFGLGYFAEWVFRDVVDNSATFPFVDANGAEQPMGYDNTAPNLEQIADPGLYATFQSVNGPGLLGFSLTDPDPGNGSSGARGLRGSVVVVVLNQDGSIARTCLFGVVLVDGTCQLTEVPGLVPPLMEWSMDIAADDGVYLATAQGVDGAGNLTPAIETPFINDKTSPTPTQAIVFGSPWNGGDPERVQVSAVDNVALRRLTLEVHYGEQLSLGYGGVRDLGNPWSFLPEDRLTSEVVEFNLPVFLTSVQSVENPVNAVPGPVSAFSDLRTQVQDFAPENTTGAGLPLPQVNGTNLDFNDAGILWHGIDALAWTIVCNGLAPSGCTQGNGQQVVTFQSRTTGADTEPFFTTNVVIPFVRFRRTPGAPSPGSGGEPARAVTPEDVWHEASEFVTEVSVTSETVGSFTMHLYEITLDATLGMPAGEYELRMMGMDDAGHGLMTPSAFFEVRTF